MTYDVARRRAELTPDARAVHAAGRWHTYAELDDRARRLAALLHGRGVRAGDRVSILADNHLAHVDLILATAKLGFAYAPLNTRLALAEQSGLGSYLRPKLVLHDQSHEDGAAAAADGAGCDAIELGEYEAALAATEPDAAPAPPRLTGEETQMVLLTGGTTGLPKGAMQPYRQGFANVANTVLSWGLTPDDCVVQATPAFHAAVNAFTVPLLHLGARVVLPPRFEPGEYLRATEELGATIMFLVPTMFHMVAQHERFGATDLSGVRWAISGGAGCPEPVREAFLAHGVRFKQGYGLTEAGVNCFAITLEQADERPDSVGKPVLYASAAVRRPDGTVCDAGEVGELTLAGPHVFTGYLDRPAETAAVLRDGWLWTGDLASVDDDGYYRIVGRRKEMFVSGGENVYPSEVEAALYDFEGVAECAVVSVPDERWGEVGVAVVTLRAADAATPDDLRAFLKERLANYKVPKRVLVVGSLPKSAAGKILKTEITRRLEAGDDLA